MTVTVVLDLPPELERQLREGLARHDTEQVQQLLAQALVSTPDTWVQPPVVSLEEEEFEAVADQLADSLAESLAPDTPTLSDAAISRAGIYAEHP